MGKRRFNSKAFAIVLALLLGAVVLFQSLVPQQALADPTQENAPASVKLTLIASSIDGEGLAEPFEIEIPSGTSVAEMDESVLNEAKAHFDIDGYVLFRGNIYVMTKPFGEFGTSQQILDEDDAHYKEPLTKATTFYVPFLKLVDTISLSVEAPVCGAEVENGIDMSTFTPYQTNAPVVTAKEDSQLPISTKERQVNVGWIEKDSPFTDPFFTGTIEGGETYRAQVKLDGAALPFGVVLDIDYPPTITVDGAVEGSISYDTAKPYQVTFDVKADHDWDEGEETIPATIDTQGEMAFKCKRFETCGGTKTEPIDKLPAVTLTLHWSSLDGVDLMDPIPIRVEKGTTLGQAIRSAGYSSTYTAVFEKEGYAYMRSRTPKPMTEYADLAALDDADSDLSYHTPINEDMDVYHAMAITVRTAEVTIQPPVCGTATETPESGDDWSWDSQTNTPKVSVPADAPYVLDMSEDEPPAYWDLDDTGDIPFIGTFEGGKDYFFEVYLEGKYGYALGKDTEITINGGTVVEQSPFGYWARGTVTAVHDWDEGTIGKDPTCTKPGEKVIACKYNDENWHSNDVSVPEEIPALGHSWGPWTLSVEPQVGVEGKEQRTCSRCGEVETRVVPALDPEESIRYRDIEGDGNVWTKGSGKTSDFVFQRSVEDELAFSHFVGIQVDGQNVDKSDYIAQSGSVIVQLKPAYLETLALGEHTLTALFDDGNNVTVGFTVVAAKKVVPAPSTKTTTPSTGDAATGAWLLAAAAGAASTTLSHCLKRRED